jgi:NitT/TauT family transport system permease protein/sulfonate transport system permease protein
MAASKATTASDSAREGGDRVRVRTAIVRLLCNRSAMMILSPAIALAVWQLLVAWGVISTDSFTSPAQVFAALVEVVLEKNAALRGSLALHVWASLQEVLLGFLLAAAIGVPTGLLMGWSRIAFNFLDPLVELLRPIPPTAWVAISLLIFGLGLQQKVFVVFVGTVSPILITTLDGVRGIDPILLKVARTHNASQADTLRKVVLPALLPSILTSFRVAIGMGWMVVVAAELIAAEAGLGYLLIQAYRIFRMDVMIAVMLIIGLLALLMDRGMRWAQRRLLAWQEADR